MDETMIERIDGWDDLLLDDDGLDDALDRALTLTRNALAGSPAVSLTVRVPNGDGPTTRAATHEHAKRLDEWQYVNGEGPCITADMESAVCFVPNLHDDETFPDFAAVALDIGVHGAASFPLLAGDRTIGSLNVFYPDPGVVDEEQVELGRNLAATASPMLANFLTHQRARQSSEQLQTALETRAVIERAKGLLMARLGIGADRAFELLSTQSQHENRKLRDIAADMVERHETEVAGHP